MSARDPMLDVERSLPRDQRQAMIASWAELAFGREEATGLPQRGLRLLEEAIEAFQACGGDQAIAHKLVAHVFGRPPGEEECREVHRVLSKPVGDFTERNASKNAAGFLQLVAGKALPPNPCQRETVINAVTGSVEHALAAQDDRGRSERK